MRGLSELAEAGGSYTYGTRRSDGKFPKIARFCAHLVREQDNTTEVYNEKRAKAIRKSCFFEGIAINGDAEARSVTLSCHCSSDELRRRGLKLQQN